MTTEALVAQEIGRAGRRGIPHPVRLSILSAGMLWLSFPPLEWAWTAWFALVPFFLLIRSTRSPWAIYLGAWVGGYAFWLGAVHWIWWTDESAWLGWLAMALALSFFWPTFLFLARFAHRRLKLPPMVAAPVFWVMLEYARAYVLTGFPWYYLAHSQYRLVYVTQIADFAGSLGVSFLIAGVNAYLAELLTTPLFRPGASGSWWRRLTFPQRARLAAVGFGLGGTLLYGAYRIHSSSFRPGPRFALLQTGEVQQYDSDKRKSNPDLQAGLERLVAMASRAVPRPDLIVWPETSNPYGYFTIDPQLDLKRLDELVKQIDPEYIAADWTLKRDRINSYFRGWMDALGIPMMVGSTIHDFRASGYSRYNSAILFARGPGRRPELPQAPPRPVRRIRPAPRNLPLVAPPDPLSRHPDPLPRPGGRPDLVRPRPLPTGLRDLLRGHGAPGGRPSSAEGPGGRQPDVLVNLSNDGWFHETSEHEMHLAVSTFRSIENRVPLARAVNTGVSAIDRRQRPDRPLDAQGQDRRPRRRGPARRPDHALLATGATGSACPAWP